VLGEVGPGHHRIAYVIALLLAVPLLVRRAHPAAAFLATMALVLAQVLLGLPPWLSDIAVVVTLYTAVAYGPRWAAGAGALVAAAAFGAVAGMVVVGWPMPHWPSVPFGSEGFVLTAAVLMLACTLGYVARAERRRREGRVEQTAGAEHGANEAEAQVTATAEQTRMVHELHDMVAHNVSAMVVQADGAQYALDSDPAQARRALEVISETGRQSLTEMRQLVRMLRSDNGEDRFVPQPGMAQMAELVDQVRAAGVPVRFAVVGQPVPLGQTGELAAYRIVQEALVNAVRHGGAAMSAEVLLRYGDSALEIEVVDDGRGVVGELPEDWNHALVRMRERAAMFGGTVQAGPREGGGFRVVAVLPASRGRSVTGGTDLAGSARGTADRVECAVEAAGAIEAAGTRQAGSRRLLGTALPASVSGPAPPERSH